MASRIQTNELLELQCVPGRVRNMCILAHVDHGKTTLADLLISSNGLISERQAGKMRYLDSMEDEQKRGITMRASAISLLYRHKRGKGGKGKGGKGADASAATSSTGADLADNGNETGPGRGTGIAVVETTLAPDSKPQQAAAAAPPPPPPAAPVVPAAAAAATPYLVNLIDSPGHIDFCSDVSTATRLCDGALVVVDAVEGVCVQTHAVLRQAWRERMKPCLVLNKVDRLATELCLDPSEAWHRLRRTVERVNALAGSLLVNMAVEEDLFQDDDDRDDGDDGDAGDDDDDEAEVGGEKRAAEKGRKKRRQEALELLEEEWTFAPEKGNVVFASAVDGWAFSIGDFAKMWAPRISAAAAAAAAAAGGGGGAGSSGVGGKGGGRKGKGKGGASPSQTVVTTTAASSSSVKPRQLREYLWGDFSFNPKTGKVTKLRQKGGGGSDGSGGSQKSMFVALVLDPIWQLYEASSDAKAETTPGGGSSGEAASAAEAAAAGSSFKKTIRMATRLGTEVSEREGLAALKEGPKGLARLVLRRWLPLSEAVLCMAVDHMPSPEEAQPKRLRSLFRHLAHPPSLSSLSPPPSSLSSPSTAAAAVAEAAEAAVPTAAAVVAAARLLEAAVAACDRSPDAPVSVFVSKMVAVPAKELRTTTRLTAKMAFGGGSSSGSGSSRRRPEFWTPPPKPTSNSVAESGGGGEVEAEDEVSGEDEVLIGFARVFSGILRAPQGDLDEWDEWDEDADDDKEEKEKDNPMNSFLFLLGPKHDPHALEVSTSVSIGGGAAAAAAAGVATDLSPEAEAAAAPAEAGAVGTGRAPLLQLAQQQQQQQQQPQQQAPGAQAAAAPGGLGQARSFEDCVALTSDSVDVLEGRVAFRAPAPSSSSSSSSSLSPIERVANKPEKTAKKKRERSPIALYLIMGDSLVPVESVPAGSICAIAGLDRFSSAKCATLVGNVPWAPLAPCFQAMAVQARPMLRVAVEAESASDIPLLTKGLLKLNHADPAVEITTTSSGEQVVAALGELHLEQCLKDLRERYCRRSTSSSTGNAPSSTGSGNSGESGGSGSSADLIGLRVSAPLLSFREGTSFEPTYHDAARAAAAANNAAAATAATASSQEEATGPASDAAGAPAAAGTEEKAQEGPPAVPRSSRKAAAKKASLRSWDDAGLDVFHRLESPLPPQLRTPPWASGDEFAAAFVLKPSPPPFLSATSASASSFASSASSPSTTPTQPSLPPASSPSPASTFDSSGSGSSYGSWIGDGSGGSARVPSTDGTFAVTVRARAMPTEFANLLDSLSSGSSGSSESSGSGGGAGGRAGGRGGGGDGRGSSVIAAALAHFPSASSSAPSSSAPSSSASSALSSGHSLRSLGSYAAATTTNAATTPAAAAAEAAETVQPNAGGVASPPTASSPPKDLRAQVCEGLQSCALDGEKELLVALGPKGVGPNLLVRLASSSSPTLAPALAFSSASSSPPSPSPASPWSDAHSVGSSAGELVVRAHPSVASLCRFLASDPEARPSATPILRNMARANTTTIAAVPLPPTPLKTTAATAATAAVNISLFAPSPSDLAWAMATPEEKGAQNNPPLSSSASGGGGGGGYGFGADAAAAAGACGHPAAPQLLTGADAEEVWRRVGTHVVSGFQHACASGPLTEV